MPVTNESVLHIWSLGVAFTGLSGNMSAAGTRHVDESTSAAITESFTIAEIGSTGVYSILYTPTVDAVYRFEVTETSLGLTESFEDDVQTGASTAVVTNSYASLADEEAFSRLGAPSASTDPTEAEVTLFLENRSAELYGLMAAEISGAAPGPSGYSTTIDTGTDVGLALSKVLRMATAIGAAMDRLQSAGAGEQPSRTERVTELAEMYAALGPSVLRLALEYASGGVTLAATNYSTGQSSKATVTRRTDSSPVFDVGTEW